jgi:hypothetical protein
VGVRVWGSRETDFNKAGAFVPEDHVLAAVVLVCAADAGVGDLDENFIWADLAGAGALDDVTRLGAFEDSERDHSGGDHLACWRRKSGYITGYENMSIGMEIDATQQGNSASYIKWNTRLSPTATAGMRLSSNSGLKENCSLAMVISRTTVVSFGMRTPSARVVIRNADNSGNGINEGGDRSTEEEKKSSMTLERRQRKR